VLLEVEGRRDRAFAVTRALDQRGQRAVAIGPDHQADMLGLVEQLRA
jgi:hypothetical protein